MIDTDETGQAKWQEVLDKYGVNPGLWTEWERQFILGNQRTKYAAMSSNMKNVVGRLHEKLVGK